MLASIQQGVLTMFCTEGRADSTMFSNIIKQENCFHKKISCHKLYMTNLRKNINK